MITSGLVKQIGPYSNGGYPSTYYDSDVQAIRPYMMYQDKPGILPPSQYAGRSVVSRNAPFQNYYRTPKKLKQAVDRSQATQVNLLFNGGLSINGANNSAPGPVPEVVGNPGPPITPGTSIGAPTPATTPSTEFFTPQGSESTNAESITPSVDNIIPEEVVDRSIQGYRGRRPPGLTINTNRNLPSPEDLIRVQQRHDLLAERIANTPSNGMYPSVPRAWLDELSSLNSVLTSSTNSSLTTISSLSEYGGPPPTPPVTPQLPSYAIGYSSGTPPGYSSPTSSAAQEMRDREAMYHVDVPLNEPAYGHWEMNQAQADYFTPIVSPNHSEPRGQIPALTIPTQGMAYERIIFSQLNNMSSPTSTRSRDSSIVRSPSDVSMGSPSISPPSDVSMGPPSSNSYGSSGPSRHGSDGGEYIQPRSRSGSVSTPSTSSPHRPQRRNPRRNTRN